MKNNNDVSCFMSITSLDNNICQIQKSVIRKNTSEKIFKEKIEVYKEMDKEKFYWKLFTITGDIEMYLNSKKYKLKELSE